MLQFSHKAIFNNKEYRIDVHLGSFDKLDISKIKQVYGLILNAENKMLVVKHKRGDWLLPGGGVEQGETTKETLIREVYEEAAIYLDLNSIKEGFYQEIYGQNELGIWQREVIQLRYVAKLKTEDKFVTDPDGGIVEIKWIEIDYLGEYIKWGLAVKLMQSVLKN